MAISSARVRQGTTLLAAVTFTIAASALHASQPVGASSDSTTETSELNAIIVTGTRQSGTTAAASPAPIQILSADAIQAASGNPDLMSTLAQLVPSLTLQAYGNDLAASTLQVSLRGLSPNHVLILVNGKRRHTTANLAVDAQSIFQGGAGVDMSFIPVDAIDHIEVLTEGAAAQYGTDAIAGVINIILKKDSSGGEVDGTYGNYFDNGGNTGDVGGHFGFEPIDGSYFNVTGEVHNHGHSNVGDVDPRLTNPGILATYPNSNVPQVPGYPYLNQAYGDGEVHTKLIAFNSGFQLGTDMDFYLFGTYGDKSAATFANYRLPDRVEYTDPVTGITTYPLPFGFSPLEATVERDWSMTSGLKGSFADWNWDLSSAYGVDHVEPYTLQSVNVSLYSGGSLNVSNFYDGLERATQWTSTIDINRNFNVGMAGPMNLAFGGEYRRESYEIGAGTPSSYEDGGAQSYPGFTPTDAGVHDRKNEAAYVDLAINPIEGLRIDAAGRFEHYSDFGNATVGKLTARYDFVPEFAIRGTISTGFRAPTLAEEYYSSTQVNPTTATVQLPPNSPAGKLLGLGDGLRPEKSVNYSAGFVFRPLPAMSVTLDLFQILITDRIVGSGQLVGTNGGIVSSQAVVNAIAATGTQLDPSVMANGLTAISVFANGIDTVTRGADLAFDFPVDYALGHVNYTIGATYNDTAITRIPPVPAALGGQRLYDATAISDLTTAHPKFVVNLAALWSTGKLSVNVVEQIYGPSSEYEQDYGDNPTGLPEYFKSSIGTTPITNLDLGYNLTKQLKVDIGAINLLNRFPPNYNSTYLAHGTEYLDVYEIGHGAQFSPFGINGGFYYVKAKFSF